MCNGSPAGQRAEQGEPFNLNAFLFRIGSASTVMAAGAIKVFILKLYNLACIVVCGENPGLRFVVHFAIFYRRGS